MRRRWVPIIAIFMLIAAACSSSDAGDTTTTAAAPTTVATTLATTTTATPTTTTTPATTTTEAVEPAEGEDLGRSLDAPSAVITVDGDASDWALVPGLATTLEPIEAEAGEPIDNRDITIKMAHDDENVYALLTVEDDYNWNPDDGKLSAAVAML
ncbi:hypothetical protein MNBD_ACTINO02-1490, partial [hydrothermal vent metagenome]